jgi:BsuBI/PstI restriction endonuclease domain/BsuBI/PstI restriction endonuclease HTH domain
MLGTRAIMDWIRDEYGLDYAANTRETVRRFTLHQFAEAHLVEQNADQPDRPINSPKWNYQVTIEALAVVRLYGTPAFEPALTKYLDEVPGLKAKYAAARTLNRMPITLPDGTPFNLSPGGQNILIKQMVDDFCPQFTPGGQVVYVGDADTKWAMFDAERLAGSGVTVDQHGKMPDLVVYLEDRGWLVLMEAASSHGPVDAQRRAQLAELFKNATPGLVYVSCFPSRREMRRYSARSRGRQTCGVRKTRRT